MRAHDADQKTLITQIHQLGIECEHSHGQQICQIASQCIESIDILSKPVRCAFDVCRDQVVQVFYIASLSFSVADKTRACKRFVLSSDIGDHALTRAVTS